MAPRSPRHGKSRYSDPSSASLTPMTGAFPRPSPSSRSHSLSPRKRESKQPLHIKMNLTETQMNKITDAFTQKVDSSAIRDRGSMSVSPSKNATLLDKSSPKKHRNKYSLESSETNYGSYRFATTSQENASSVSLAERRRRATPAPIQVEDSHRWERRTPQRAKMQAIPSDISPLSPREMYEAGSTQPSGHDGSNRGFHAAERPAPLKLQETCLSNNSSHPQTPRTSQVERNDASPDYEGGFAPAPTHTTQQSPTRLPHVQNTFLREYQVSSRSPRKGDKPEGAVETPLFSPFPFYLGRDFPCEKRGQKTMIGEGGWLERTDESPEKGKKSGSRKKGIFDGIKKIAKDMSELPYAGRRSQHALKEPTTSQVAISLDAREQSLLYGELEFHLTNSINTYITTQLGKGRLVTDKLKKIADAWLHQGRPRVVGFRYDLETQLDLIHAHIDDFVFSGRRQGNPVEIAGLVHAMKVNARAMRIRTFCQPDSVIAKQLVEAQSLFNMLGVSRADNLALAEVAQFFKVCIAREEGARLKELRKIRKSKLEHWQRFGLEDYEEEDVILEQEEPGL